VLAPTERSVDGHRGRLAPAAPLRGGRRRVGAFAEPRDKDGKTLKQKERTLQNYIDVAYEMKWIGEAAKIVSGVMRDYRKLHPPVQRTFGRRVTDIRRCRDRDFRCPLKRDPVCRVRQLAKADLLPRSFYLIEFGLDLRDPSKLKIQIVTDRRQRVAVLFEDLSSLVQHLDHAVELRARDG
jgi:hypothetical protein